MSSYKENATWIKEELPGLGTDESGGIAAQHFS